MTSTRLPSVTPCYKCCRAVFLMQDAQEGPSKRFTWHFCLDGRHKPRSYRTEPSGAFQEAMVKRGCYCPAYLKGSPAKVDLPPGFDPDNPESHSDTPWAWELKL